MGNSKRNVLILALSFAVASCVYDNISITNADPHSVFLGKWMIKKDSLNFGGDGLNYLKSNSDYYDFQPNGNLIVNEGGAIDSAMYSVSAGNLIDIVYRKIVWVKYFQLNDGVVVKDSILNRFSERLIVSDLSPHSVKLSAMFYWRIKVPAIAGPSTTDSIKVNMLTILSR